MIKKYASDKNKCILALIQQVTALGMVAILLTLTMSIYIKNATPMMYSVYVDILEKETDFRESSAFKQMFNLDLSEIIYYLAICQQFETDGEFNKKRSVDLLQYANRRETDSEKITSNGTLEYRVGDLINWNEVDGLATETIEGTDYYKIVERYLPTDGVSIFDKDIVSILERSGIPDAADYIRADEAVSENSEWSEDWTEDWTEEEILSDGKSIRDLDEYSREEWEFEDVISDEILDGKAYTLLSDYIVRAAEDLSTNYENYTQRQSYFADNKCIKYLYVPKQNSKNKNYYTNCQAKKSAQEIKSAFEECMEKENGAYVKYDMTQNEIEAVNYDEDDKNHIDLRRALSGYEYAFPEQGTLYVACIQSNEEAMLLDGTKFQDEGAYTQAYKVYKNVKPYLVQLAAVFAGCLVIFLISLVLFSCMVGYRREETVEDASEEDALAGKGITYRMMTAQELSGFDRWYTGIAFVLAVVVEAVLFGIPVLLVAEGYINDKVQILTRNSLFMFCMMFAFLFVLGFQFFWSSLLRRCKTHTFFKNSVIFHLLGWMRKAIGKIMLALADKNVVVNHWIPYLFFLGFNFVILVAGIGFAGGDYLYLSVLIAFAVDMLIGVAGHKMYKERKEVLDGIGRIADGEITYQVDATHMHGENVLFAKAVNHIGDGIHEAVQISMKDERLKADLITNVSHDIKTPLTSIINYVDLLKRVDIEDEKAKEYLRILDEKSQRLKQLTLDLVEASKISSGNIVLHFEPIRVKDLMMQVVGEFSDKFEEKELTVIAGFPEEPVIIEADSRRMWRVMENLFNNIYKYAMPQTRVYLDIGIKEKVCITVKNISLQKLNVAADELTERFIRGDISRSTEGSGLGLSIAKSLVEAQNGEFRIVLDGDLFKVIMRFDEMKKEITEKSEEEAEEE